MYGRYELYLRRLESDVHSIVGASGSFYAQRRALCSPFTEGMAPDFLSVLRTVQQGYRAVSEPAAVGEMTSVKDPRQEFDRKVRTLLRGMTALFAYQAAAQPVPSRPLRVRALVPQDSAMDRPVLPGRGAAGAAGAARSPVLPAGVLRAGGVLCDGGDRIGGVGELPPHSPRPHRALFLVRQRRDPGRVVSILVGRPPGVVDAVAPLNP